MTPATSQPFALRPDAGSRRGEARKDDDDVTTKRTTKIQDPSPELTFYSGIKFDVRRMRHRGMARSMVDGRPGNPAFPASSSQ